MPASLRCGGALFLLQTEHQPDCYFPEMRLFIKAILFQQITTRTCQLVIKLPEPRAVMEIIRERIVKRRPSGIQGQLQGHAACAAFRGLKRRTRSEDGNQRVRERNATPEKAGRSPVVPHRRRSGRNGRLR